MNALQGMDRYRKEVIQVSTQKNDIKVQYLYDIKTQSGLATEKNSGTKNNLTHFILLYNQTGLMFRSQLYLGPNLKKNLKQSFINLQFLLTK